MTFSTAQFFKIGRPCCQGVGSDALAAGASDTYMHSYKYASKKQTAYIKYTIK